MTLDNWNRVGYGDDVVAFYSKGEQIKKYSLEEVLFGEETDLEKVRLLQHLSYSLSSR